MSNIGINQHCHHHRVACPVLDVAVPTSVLQACLEGKRENYQVCSVQYCVQQLYTVNCTHIWTDLTVLWIGFCLTEPISLCLDLFLYMYYCMHEQDCSMVRWNWWDWSLSLELLLPSVLRHCWLGHLTRKTHPDMTYNVFSGTLNPAQSINRSTVVWCSYYTPTFVGLTCLSASSTNCVWSCADAGRHCSTVSGGTLVTSLWDRITTASSFGYQPSTDSAATSADHIWRSGICCRWSVDVELTAKTSAWSLF